MSRRVALASIVLVATGCSSGDFLLVKVSGLSKSSVGLRVELSADGRSATPESYSLPEGHGDALTLGLKLPLASVVLFQAIAFNVEGCATDFGLGASIERTGSTDLKMVNFTKPVCGVYDKPGAAHRVRIAPRTDVSIGCARGTTDCGMYALSPRTISTPLLDMDRFEVTGAAYAACVGAGRCSQVLYDVDDDVAQPMTWAQAKAYCTFAGGRLPTEIEWEAVARAPNGRVYPWDGTTLDCNHALYGACNHTGPISVFANTDGLSAFGLSHMAGNLAEWTSDSAPTASGTLPTTRGGGWSSSAGELLTTERVGYLEDTNTLVGTRCVSDVN